MSCTRHSCWDAKNRYGLPDEVPFEYSSISHIIGQPSTGAAIPKETMAPAEEKQVAMDLTQEFPSASKGTEKPEKETEATPPVETKPEPVKETEAAVDLRIPKNLRDLMVSNQVDEWDIQNVVAARGYFPEDMAVWDYPKNFIDGCLVGAWDKVCEMIKEMKEKDALVFN